MLPIFAVLDDGMTVVVCLVDQGNGEIEPAAPGRVKMKVNQVKIRSRRSNQVLSKRKINDRQKAGFESETV